MKLPQLFLPENKNLEEKLKQLAEEPKIQEQENKYLIDKTELDELLKEFYNLPENHNGLCSKLESLLGKAGYTLRKSKKHYKYWSKPADFDKQYLFIRQKGKEKQEEHYSFVMVEENKLEKFCKKFEYERKLIPLNVYLTICALSVSATSLNFLPLYFKKDALFAIPMAAVVVALSTAPYMIKYLYGKNKKNTEKYCNYLITNDEEALREAFR
ncbi:MAG: hypothetical protein Q8N77_04445 [Nanoarchaeota archaeon]|nr:hypothetical protein [Nanoarchaeota archaeon]